MKQSARTGVPAAYLAKQDSGVGRYLGLQRAALGYASQGIRPRQSQAPLSQFS